MKLYRYSKLTKEYIGEMEAYVDPLESIKLGKDIYVIPPFCTTLKAPECEGNMVPIFNEETNEWNVTEDNRGTVVFTKKGVEVLITELGPIPSAYLLQKPVLIQELKLEMIEKAKIGHDKAIREDVEINGIKINTGKRAELLLLLNTFGDFDRISYDNNDNIVLLTKEDINNICKTLYIRRTLLDLKKAEIIKSIKECTNKKDLTKLDISYNIEDELERLTNLSVEEINKHFETGV